MGGYAASGGYWIASHASRIVADPCTLTGSIGAFAGKIQFAELANRLGISFYEVDRGAPSMWSMTEGLTDTQQQRLGTSIDAIYRSFVQAVADGRHLKPEAVEAAAEGRVWTGAQARDLHLVDALGGYTEAIDAARQLAGLPADTAIALSFPRTTSILQELQTLTALMRTSFAPDLANAAAAWLDELHALANAGTVEMLPIHIH
jgi:protease-4